MSEWISVKERLPEPNIKEFEGSFSAIVQIFDRAHNHWLGFYCHGGKGERPGWWINQGFADDYCVEDDEIYSPTHWMPLPEPPKEQPERELSDMQQKMAAMIKEADDASFEAAHIEEALRGRIAEFEAQLSALLEAADTVLRCKAIESACSQCLKRLEAALAQGKTAQEEK